MEVIDRLIPKLNRVKLTLQPPIEESELAQFESDAGIRIPEDYREFLLRIANGGKDDCRLIPLSWWDASYWIDHSQPSMAGQPCLLTQDLEKQGEKWIDHLKIPNWSKRWDENDWSPMFGTIAIAEFGCGLFYSMIMTGSLRGRIFIWGDHMLHPPILMPEVNFGDWFTNVVNAMMNGMPAHFLDGRLR